jgi:hypothetical protein
MKLKRILNELSIDYRKLERQFTSWLKKQKIEYRKKKANTGSEYISIMFDNGTYYGLELDVRFSDHKSGHWKASIDTFDDKITNLEQLFDRLRTEYNLVIDNGIYKGQHTDKLFGTKMDVKRGWEEEQ